MVQEINKQFKNITQEIVSIYLSLCIPCQTKQKSVRKGLVLKPIIHPEMNILCQVDLIDMQSCPDGSYSFILVYVEHLTKFVQLRPLKSTTATEMATALLDIFCIFGAPMILHSDTESEFCNNLLEQLTCMWPGLKLVIGKPCYTESEGGGAERCNQDVEKLLTTWMQDNNTNNWSDGLKFVQLMKNREYHDGLKCSPYKAMFGIDLKFGLSNSNLPKDLIEEDISTEEKFMGVVKDISMEESYVECIVEQTENTSHFA